MVCETYHDGASLQPHASSLEGCIRLKWAEGFYGQESHAYLDGQHLAEQLGLQLEPPPFHEEYQAPPLDRLLAADPSSPAVLVKAAKECLAREELESAERFLTSALQVLPEYTQAHWMLAGLYRRTRRGVEAVERTLHAFRCPPCFGGDAKQCLQWLQRSREDAPQFADDPIWQAR